MRYLACAIVVGGVAVQLSLGAAGAQNAPKPAAAASGATRTFNPEQFSGRWDYNADESVVAATGRREQGPRSATTRRPGGAGVASPRAGAPIGPGGLGPGGYGTGGYGTGGYGGYGGGQPDLTGLVYVNEMRELERDLLEIPEALQIKVSDGQIQITDDLDRERTYPTTGKKQKYQLGAAKFEARVYWEGPQLKWEIEGGESFKLRETYFLSEDGNRLFIVLRLGDPPRQTSKDAPPAPINGFNRVYDRVQ
jgi:hypothetical protein